MHAALRWPAGAHARPVLTLILASVLAPGPASAGPAQPIQVDLGTHQFGQLTAPVATVLTVPPNQVGFRGSPRVSGPGSFQVATDGRIWILDQVKNRILIWAPGGDHPAATVPLPEAVRDFAIGPDNSVYILSAANTEIASLTLTGQVRWRVPLTLLIDQDKLRTGPDGGLWWVGSEGTWTPVASPDGRPLADADQRRLTQTQPVAGGGQLAVIWAPNEVTANVLDSAGTISRSWRITSATGVLGTSVVPAYVDGDPIVPLTLYQPGMSETVVVRLTPTGARQPVALSRVMVGDMVNDIRVGPDKALYQMRVSTTAGVAIYRYTLGFPPPAPAPITSPAPATNASAAGPTTVTSVAPSGTAAAVPVTAQPPGASAPADRAAWWPWLVALGLVLLAGVTAVALLWWRRRRPGSRPAEVEPPVPAGTGPPAA